jgi:hypothetical protein
LPGIMRIARLIVAVIIAAGAASAHAACRTDVEMCAAKSPWFAGNFVTVLVEAQGKGERGFLTFSLPDPSNLKIDSEYSEQGQTRRSSVLLVDDQVMLTRDIAPEKGREIYALDGPVLIYQLVINLLSAAFPEGPDDFKGKSVVDLEEGRRTIAVSTAFSSGLYRAPWRLTGSIRRTNLQSITYAFEFEYSAGGSRKTLALNGLWAKSNPAPAIDPNLNLADWVAYALDDYTIRQDSDRVSSGAKAIPAIATSLGELQQALRRKQRR